MKDENNRLKSFKTFGTVCKQAMSALSINVRWAPVLMQQSINHALSCMNMFIWHPGDKNALFLASAEEDQKKKAANDNEAHMRSCVHISFFNFCLSTHYFSI